MIYDLQKGSLLKRVSAFILDAILLVIIAVGFAFAFSAIFHYSTYSNLYSSKIDSYAEQFDVDFDKVVSQSEYDALSEAERARYDDAVDAMNNDPEILRALNVIVRMIIAMVSVSLFLAFMVIEFFRVFHNSPFQLCKLSDGSYCGRMSVCDTHTHLPYVYGGCLYAAAEKYFRYAQCRICSCQSGPSCCF